MKLITIFIIATVLFVASIKFGIGAVLTVIIQLLAGSMLAIMVGIVLAIFGKDNI